MCISDKKRVDSDQWQISKLFAIEKRLKKLVQLSSNCEPVSSNQTSQHHQGSEQEGIPLFVVTRDKLPQWLSQHNARWSNWTRSCAHKQLVGLPDCSGTLEGWLYIIENTDEESDFTKIQSSLPTNSYRLKCERPLVKMVIWGWLLASYKYFYYQADEACSKLLVDAGTKKQQDDLAFTIDFAHATWLTRELINVPASKLTPSTFDDACRLLSENLNGCYESVVGVDLLVKNYPLIYVVGRAAADSPRLVKLSWPKENAPELALVGKGVCFDTGGLGIKGKDSMRLMKKDMGGAAHIFALTNWIVRNKINVSLVVYLPLVENAIGPEAMKPGDIVRARSGHTVEIDNTDAEGRLILADALFAATEQAPDLVIDFATLTGAMRTALGTELPGFFCNDDRVAMELEQAASSVSDPVWRMPLFQPYREFYLSDVADFINCSSQSTGKAITAALFLQEFVSNNVSWLHFDVMGYNTRVRDGRPIGGEAFGLLAVSQMLLNRYGVCADNSD